MRRLLALLLLATLSTEPLALAGLGKKKAEYVGGTLTMKQETEGTLTTDNPEKLLFKGDNGESWELPYDKFTALAYGQHAGRRIGATIGWGVTTLGVAALPILFSKKRRHYLTISFTNEQGKDEAAVFQLGKDVTRAMLAALQARTGKKVEYEDDEARKAGNK